MTNLNEINQIVTNENWNNIRDIITKWDNDRLEALRIMLLSGFEPTLCIGAIDEIIELTEITPLSTKEMVMKLSGLINRLS